MTAVLLQSEAEGRSQVSDLPFLLESRLTLLGLTDGCSSVSVDILRLQLH